MYTLSHSCLLHFLLIETSIFADRQSLMIFSKVVKSLIGKRLTINFGSLLSQTQFRGEFRPHSISWNSSWGLFYSNCPQSLPDRKSYIFTKNERRKMFFVEYTITPILNYMFRANFLPIFLGKLYFLTTFKKYTFTISLSSSFESNIFDLYTGLDCRFSWMGNLSKILCSCLLVFFAKFGPKLASLRSANLA